MVPATEASILTSLGSLHAKVDILVDAKSSHDKRIASVERKQWMISGGVAFAMVFLVGKFKTLMGY